MDPESRPDAGAPAQSSANPPGPNPASPAAALVLKLAVLAVAITALGAVIMSMRTKPPAIDYRATAPPPKQEVVRAPPLNRMGSNAGCPGCGVVESVSESKSTDGFEMRIRMDDGSIRTVEQRGAMAAGTRVVVDGAMVRLMPAPG